MQQSLKDAIRRELDAVESIAAKANAEDRDLSGEERAEVTKRFETATALRNRGKDEDDMRKQLVGLSDGLGFDDPEGGDRRPVKAQPAEFQRPQRGKSIGRQFVDSAEFKALMESAPGGRFGEKQRVHMNQPFGVKTLLTGTDDTSAGSLVQPQSLGLVEPFYQRPLTVRQLVTSGTTTSDAIEYVRLVSMTNNAAPVPEAKTAAAIGAGPPVVTAVDAGLKPESGMLFQKVTTNVKSIANWVPATKRSLSDASQIETLVNAFLVYGLEEELEDQILTGNGTGENFEGLSAVSGVQVQAAPAGALTMLDTARMARTKVRVAGRAIPTAYVMNPMDWERFELAKDAQQRYYGQGPFGLMTPTLWGLPVVESEAIPAGTAYVGDWSQAVLWDREQASIAISDSHNDFFTRNLVAILAELRAAFGVMRPSAFVRIAVVFA